MALLAILDNVTLSKRVLSGILDDITLSVAPSYKQAILNNVTLRSVRLFATLDNVTLSHAPPVFPVTEYLVLPNILTGHLSDYLMEIYYHIVDGRSFGVILDSEVIRANRLVGRYNFKVVFSDDTVIETEDWYEFVYEFATQVDSGKRLIGNNDMERSMSLSRFLPSTFNPNWLLPVALNG